MAKQDAASDTGRKHPKWVAPVVLSFLAKNSWDRCESAWRVFCQLTAGWTLEIASLALSAATFVVLLVVLDIYDGRRLDDWTLFVSLNTIVSILSTTMKALLAYVVGACLGQSKWVWFKKRPGLLAQFVSFDEASRGLWGCVPMHWFSLGAWVTILLAAVDPFMQAVIDYPGRLDAVDRDTGATMSQAVAVDIGNWLPKTQHGATASYRGQKNVSTRYWLHPDVGVAAAAMVGFVNARTTSAAAQWPALACRTGNCTWPLYSTVELCSACADISSELVQTSFLGVPAGCAKEPAASAANVTRYTVSYGQEETLTLEAYDGTYLPLGDCPSGRATKRQARLGIVRRPDQTYRFQDWDTMLAAYAIAWPTDAYYNNQVPFANATAVTATECALRFCGRIYNATMRDGVLTETPVDGAAFARSPTSFQLVDDAARALRDSIDGDFGRNALTLGDDLGVFERTDLQLVLDEGSAHRSDDVRHVDFHLNITQKTVETMAAALHASYADDWARAALASSSNLTATFAAAARAMSRSLRAETIHHQQVRGVVQQWVPHVRVRWPFVALPGLALAGAVVFAAATVRDSYRLKLAALKDSPLQQLVHGPDGATRDWLRRQADRKRAAETAVVQLVGNDKDDGENLELVALKERSLSPDIS